MDGKNLEKNKVIIYCDRRCNNKVLDENGYGYCGKESIAIGIDGFCEDDDSE